jgi:hypothetical protein
VAQLFSLGVSTTFIFMTRYFIAANLWLFSAVVAILGNTNVSIIPDLPPESAFFGLGRVHTSTYTLMVLAMFAASATFFILTWKTRKKS